MPGSWTCIFSDNLYSSARLSICQIDTNFSLLTSGIDLFYLYLDEKKNLSLLAGSDKVIQSSDGRYVKQLGKPRCFTNLPSLDWITLSIPARGDRLSLYVMLAGTSLLISPSVTHPLLNRITYSSPNMIVHV